MSPQGGALLGQAGEFEEKTELRGVQHSHAQTVAPLQAAEGEQRCVVERRRPLVRKASNGGLARQVGQDAAPRT
jgi:hypothetical protein